MRKQVNGDAYADVGDVEDVSHLPKPLAGVFDRRLGRICDGDFYIPQSSYSNCDLTGPHLYDVFAAQLFHGNVATGSDG